MFNNIKLKAKLPAILLMALIFAMSAVYYLIDLNKKNITKAVEDNIKNEVQNMQGKFNTLLEKDTQILGASLAVFLHNSGELKTLFLEKDRERLFTAGQGLHQDLKNKFEITHFYFHNTDGTNFVRLHDEEKYNDKIDRETLNESMRTSASVVGLELGKTAFALRYVEPFYDNNKIVGYVEFGKEIDKILETMRSESNQDFAIIVNKKFINKEDWSSVALSKNLRNNWGDLDKGIIINSAFDNIETHKSHEELANKCFSDKSVEGTRAGISVLFNEELSGRHYVCAGFPIKNAGNEVVGSVLAFEDVTDLFSVVQKSISFIVVSIGVIFIAIFTLYSFIISNVIIRPLKKAKDIATNIAEGNMDTPINTLRNDEIGELYRAIARMRDGLKVVFEEYEKKIKKD